MFGPNTILTVYCAPKDAYTFTNFKSWHKLTKRRWRQADVYGADEVKVLENNRRHNTKYTRPLKIFGWLSNNVKYEKAETYYQDVVGDVYFDYFKKFYGHILDWWGVGGKFTKKRKKERNVTSVPNTPMLDVSIHFDKDSFMDKIYLQGMSYDEATGTSFKGKSSSSELINELTSYHTNTGMDADEAYKESLRVAEIVQRNLALTKNSPVSNEYNFMLNYYNKFIDSKFREMMKVNINIWFLKEAMRNNPNMTFFIMGPFNRLMRVQGIVGKRCENVIIAMEGFVNTAKFNYDITYSLGSETLVNESTKGFIKAKDLPKFTTKLKNMMWGNRPCFVDHRYNSEFMYSLVLDGISTNGMFPFFDAYHNVFLIPDYSDITNLKGLDIIC